MHLAFCDDEYLYDGVLIEVGTAKCDTYQHITLDEFQDMLYQLGEFRKLVGPN